jgi:hypothetical protein
VDSTSSTGMSGWVRSGMCHPRWKCACSTGASSSSSRGDICRGSGSR